MSELLFKQSQEELLFRLPDQGTEHEVPCVEEEFQVSLPTNCCQRADVYREVLPTLQPETPVYHEERRAAGQRVPLDRPLLPIKQKFPLERPLDTLTTASDSWVHISSHWRTQCPVLLWIMPSPPPAPT